MQKIDIAQILYERSGKRVPSVAAFLLSRMIHQSQLNSILDAGRGLTPEAFVKHVLGSLNISYSITRTGELNPTGRYVFVANHPLGGPDGLVLADVIADMLGTVGVVANDMLAQIDPLAPLFIPVNKYGRQSTTTSAVYDAAMQSSKPILTFPAGFCSRITDGRVTDTEWKPRFVRDAVRYDRRIVPVYVDGTLSKRFYALYRCRRVIGLKTNIELLLLVDEMFRLGNSNLKIVIGQPVDASSLHGDASTKCRYVREAVYALRQKLL